MNTKQTNRFSAKKTGFVKLFLKRGLASLLMLTTLLVWQCKKDNYKGEIVGLCPKVISTNPANLEQNVVVNKRVSATFNEAMDPATINGSSFILEEGPNRITGTVTYSGVTATFTPAKELAINTLYTGTITTAARNPLKTAIEQNYVWTFRTGIIADTIKPIVISTDPQNNEKDVVLNKIISATFSEIMDPVTINNSTFLLNEGANAIAGVVNYSGVSATFTPSAQLTANTLYTGTIKTGAKDASGNAIAADYIWSFTTGSALDTIRPTVISTIPTDNAVNVPLNNSITATFSEAMDPTSITAASFIVNDGINPIAGIVSYNGITATFKPTSNLVSGKTYLATITTVAKDLAGNTMLNNYFWNFSTGNAPVVISTDPANFAMNVPLNKVIKATFSKPMDPLTINNTTFTLKEGSNIISGAVTYTGIVASFKPTLALSAGKTYTATITTGAKDLSGVSIVSNYIWTFTTAINPIVVSTDPANNAIGVPLNKVITASFSDIMDPTTISNSTFLLKQGANVISGTVTYTGVTASFNPSSNLLPGTLYTATITTGAKNLLGNSLASDYVWSFTTANAPTVILTDPLNNATNVKVNKIISATFSVQMDANTITTSTFLLKEGANSITGVVNYSGTKATFTPSANLLPNTKYTATITTGAKDLAGTPLGSDYVWSFTTTGPSGPGLVDLDCVADYVVIAGSTVTNTGATIVDGDLGLSPGSAVSGFPPGTVINGSLRINDSKTNAAKLCLTTAYNDAAGRTTDVIVVSDGQLGGKTFAPGLYKSAPGSFAITGSDFTVDAKGNADAVWIFQMPSSTLTVGNGLKVTLLNGAQAKNIFWQVGTSATIGTTAEMKGNILADQSITLKTGAVLLGRALTRIAAVTLDNNAVTKP